MGSDWLDFLCVPIDEFVINELRSQKLITLIWLVVFREKFDTMVAYLLFFQ